MKESLANWTDEKLDEREAELVWRMHEVTGHTLFNALNEQRLDIRSERWQRHCLANGLPVSGRDLTG